MNKIDKTLMLAEEFGVDVSSFTSSYLDAVVSSTAYAKLVENVCWAKNFPLKKAVALVSDFKSLNYNINSFEESVILASRINYLCSVSDESFYLNPLFTFSSSVKTKSLGDLSVNYLGEDHTFNELIKNKTRSLDFKAKVIEKKVSYYNQEVDDFLTNIYSKTKVNKGMKSIVRKTIFTYLLLGIMAAACFLFDIYMMVSTRHVFTWTFSHLRDVKSISLAGWGVLAFYVFSLMFFFFTILLGGKISYIFTPFFYFRRFGRAKTNKVFQRVNKKAQQLADYLFKACKNQKELSGDIKMFMLPKKFVSELTLYAEGYKIKSNKGYKILKFLAMVFLSLTVISVLYIGVIYLLKKYKVIN